MPTHDGEYHILRFWQFDKVISDGTVYPRWAPDFNNGYGVPLFSYVYPLPNYLSVLLHVVGFGFIDSFKCILAISTIIAGVFFYLWSRDYWGTLGGIVASTCYLFSPYHFVDIYVRGSIGEVVALGIFPGLLWSYTHFLFYRKPAHMVITCFLLALLIYAHNILALIFFVFFILYALFLLVSQKSKKIDMCYLLLIVCIGWGLAAPFWIPAILEKSYVQGLQIYDVTRHFPQLYQLLIPSWGFGLSPDDLADPMSIQIGVANLLAVLLSIVFYYRVKEKKIILFFIALFFVVFFLMSSYSKLVWMHVPLLFYVQFPWRLLSVEIIIASFLAGSVVPKRKMRNLVAIVMVIITIFFSIGYAKAATYYNRTDMYYLKRANFTKGTNSPGDAFNTIWLQGIPKTQANKSTVLRGKAALSDTYSTSTSYKTTINTKKGVLFQVPKAYFPGWTATLDGMSTNVYNMKGMLSVRVPSGTHVLLVSLKPTRTQTLSYIYFWVSVIFLIVFYLYSIGIMKKWNR